jgi:hypothetical protein
MVLLIAFGCLLFTPITRAEGPFDVDRTTNDDGRTDGALEPGNGQGEGDGSDEAMFGAGENPSDWWYVGLVLRLSIHYLFDNLNIADHTTAEMQRSGQQVSGAEPAVFR